MSIKNTIKRLEGKVARGFNTHPITYIVPYSQTEAQRLEMERLLIKSVNKNTLIVFVVDYARAE